MKSHFRELQAGQPVPIYGARIQSDLVFHDQGHLKRGMAENDLFSEIIIRIDKGVPDPDHVVKRLFPYVHARPETGMHHIEILKLF